MNNDQTLTELSHEVVNAILSIAKERDLGSVDGKEYSHPLISLDLFDDKDTHLLINSLEEPDFASEEEVVKASISLSLNMTIQILGLPPRDENAIVDSMNSLVEVLNALAGVEMLINQVAASGRQDWIQDALKQLQQDEVLAPTLLGIKDSLSQDEAGNISIDAVKEKITLVEKDIQEFPDLIANDMNELSDDISVSHILAKDAPDDVSTPYHALAKLLNRIAILLVANKARSLYDYFSA